ncbi:MAG: class I SAM-dependent methyltransferase [Gemmataceae bacterium]
MSTEVEHWLEAPAPVQRREPMPAPFARLNGQIVKGVAAQYFHGAGSLLEIGGDQLRPWLNGEWADRFGPASESANALPAADASQDSVLGLDVFDQLDDPERARDEIARVLAPGGTFLHFLDEGQGYLEPLFDHLVRSGEIPFPNFLADEGLLSQLDENQRARLPEAALHHDLLVASWQEFGAVLQILFELGHSISNRLIPYARLFRPATFNLQEAAAEFRRLREDGRARERLNKMLLTVYLAVTDDVDQELAPLHFRPLAAHEYFAGRLAEWFDDQHGFDIEMCELVAAREERVRGGELPAPDLYHLCSVGQRLSRRNAPDQLVGRDLATLGKNARDHAQRHHAELCVVESGMHVFVARKR